MRIEFKKYYFIVHSKKIIRFIGNFTSFGKQPVAAAFWPFIFVNPDTEEESRYQEIIRHETIHIRQEIELLVIFAELIYILEYCYARYIKKLDPKQSYYWTSMEQEAHRNAMNPNYLKARKPYATFKYLFDKKWLGRTEDHQLIVKDF